MAASWKTAEALAKAANNAKTKKDKDLLNKRLQDYLIKHNL